jgi:hypothetical protein
VERPAGIGAAAPGVYSGSTITAVP